MSNTVCRVENCVHLGVHEASDACRIEPDPESPWTSVVRRCYVRLTLLQAMTNETLACPWGQLEGFTCDSSCRCEGVGAVTPAFMIAHYEGMLDYFETDNCRHPMEHSIEAAVSLREPKAFSQVMREVEEDYGTISPVQGNAQRQVHRYLARLVKRGRIMRVNLGNQLYAYLKLGSKIADDHVFVREMLKDSMAAQAQMAGGC